MATTERYSSDLDIDHISTEDISHTTGDHDELISPLMEAHSGMNDSGQGCPPASPLSTSSSEQKRGMISAVRTDEKSPDDKRDGQPRGSACIRRSYMVLIMVLVYTAFAVFSWIILCVQTFRPVTTASYNRYNGPAVDHAANVTLTGTDLMSVYAQNQHWFQAAQFIQSVVAVLTIPLTSAVCSKAAVIFTQRPRTNASKLSLRKTITLANRGWTDPAIYARLTFGGYRLYGSPLLLLSISLIISGGVISPLQSLFLTVSTIKTPTSPTSISGLPDLSDFFPYSTGPGDNLVSVLTRSAITSTFRSDPQSRLWTPGMSECNVSQNQSDSSSCIHGVPNLMNLSQYTDPFLAPLPSGFNTGLISQYLPRMNSTVVRENITAEDFPSQCGSLPGSFFVDYNHPGVDDSMHYAGNWSLVACMPQNQSSSPWKPTRDRQDIVEQLYLNISLNTFLTQGLQYSRLIRLTMGSTLGYFELPNYSNGQTAGPLLSRDPFGGDFQSFAIQLPPIPGSYRRGLNIGSDGMSNSSVILQSVNNKGPLLNIAMALFGENSYIANRYQHPDVYLLNFTNTQMWDAIDHGANELLYTPVCVDLEPLMGLLNGVAQPSSNSGGLYPGCIMNLNNQDDTLQRQIEEWVLSLTNAFSSDTISQAFEAAAFLANEAWLVQSPEFPSLFVSYDMGAEAEIPVISKAGIIVISILLFVFHATLLAVAWYATSTPAWTSELDAFAMIRIGAAISDDIAFAYVDKVDKVEILDETPGWVGDATSGRGPVGELGLGAPAALKKGRKVHAYSCKS